MRAWMVRSGKAGEREQWALSEGYTGGGFGDIEDLTDANTRELVVAALTRALPASKDGAIRTFANQLWALRGVMSKGDLVVMPLKTGPELAIGRVLGEYRYLDAPDLQRRHVRPVEWIVTDLPRTAVRQDLLHTLGAFSTICEVSRNDGARRVEGLLKTRRDPGVKVAPVSKPGKSKTGSATAAVEDDDPVAEIEIEQYARDKIQARVGEVFTGHGLTTLVAAILRAKGFTCDVAPPGPDGGIDILAGTGPLGLDAPRLVVSVKSETTQVGRPVVQQLHGAVSGQKADQGLLVAWGGVTRPAREELNANRFVLKLWNADDVLAGLFRHYEEMSASIQAEIPLKQVWTLVEESG
ncbi:restriction endonuclease [Amycolatopsis keratiniphila]|uniref:restriction endonuclease n=1 Tax=Amycolatopsis keratiniphila TaxID=129921 RepID=UPI00087B36AC|nr:restriction endonuclease [Amycolatopsis keratiniphila]OLZ51885.1 hypothetical protein BS330_24895 [Amycolatopsis keratiniphila subsp. nogabecina]SDU62240.1 restriction system protein [Amycolatopsis keratiniphila]